MHERVVGTARTCAALPTQPAGEGRPDVRRVAAAGRLLLVRHARTAGNANRQPMGRQDLPLDDTGRAQVLGLTAALERVVAVGVPASIHSSPLTRATETIAPFAEARAVPVQLDPALMEMDFGTAAHGANRDRKLRVKGKHMYDPMPGGESLSQVWHRCQDFFARARPELLSGRTVVVVTHYRIGQLLAGLAADMDFETAVHMSTYRPPPASLFEIQAPASGRPAAAPVLVWSPPDASQRVTPRADEGRIEPPPRRPA
jgi:glucosyl-3-phosphoglycerate phosphatase